MVLATELTWDRLTADGTAGVERSKGNSKAAGLSDAETLSWINPPPYLSLPCISFFIETDIRVLRAAGCARSIFLIGGSNN